MSRNFFAFCCILTLALGCKSQPQVDTDDGVRPKDRKTDSGADRGDAGVTRGDGGSELIDEGDELITPGKDNGDTCEPKTCDDVGATCGSVADGCGDLLDCGTCDEDARCGIVERNVCTNLSDLCEKSTKEEACEGRECGLTGDGCGGSINCGECGDDEACGVVELFQCGPLLGGGDGGVGGCRPQSAEQACAGKQCAKAFDGCGAEPENTYDCAELSGGCADDEYCGLFEPFQCDALPVVECDAATSCEDLGWACGVAVDDCGNTFDCAEEGLSCDTATEACVGGVDGPTECLAGGGTAGFLNCDVCDAIPTCEDDDPTRLTGRVITPGRSAGDTANQVGVPNAFVYILRNNDSSQLPPIATGIPVGGTSCERCEDEDLGPVLASGTTNALGEYVLEGNIPVDREFVLVVKIGKFRRAEVMTLDADTACTTTAIDPQLTRLPRSADDGVGANLPHIAVSTGQIDAMECVFHKMGIETAEFSQPGADGTAESRVHMYRGNGARMADGSTTNANLHDSEARLFSYDMVVYDCEGPGFQDHDSADPNMRHYVNSGGRLFASHLSYTWIFDNGAADYSADAAIETGLSQSASFPGTAGGGPANGTGIVSTGRPRGNADKLESFSAWLVNEGVATYNATNDQYTFDILDPRNLASTVNESSEEFVYWQNGGSDWVQQYAFNTPYGAPEDAICGRVAYSAFHVSSGGTSNAFANAVFPDYCSGSLTNQEKVLLYMLFDLGACVTTEVVDPPSCEPVAECTGRCGVLPDGCGGTLDCTCPSGQQCLPGGVCGSTECTPASCEAQGAECGKLADGCGGVADCGPCPEGEVCGLSSPNQCGKPPKCTPLACEEQDAECGVIGDGCGGQVDCGPCPSGEVCGLKEAYKCDAPNCPALTCEDAKAECGTIGDGCGKLLDCGPCPTGEICGLRKANQCAAEPLPVQ